MMKARPLPVLVAVDDTLAILKIIDLYFSPEFTVHTFEDGGHFLSWADAHPPPTVCILDLMMPGLDGLELLQKLRSRPSWHQTLIIILSSKYSAVNRDRAVSLGADVFEQKPFDPDQLRQTIQTLLERR